MNNMQVVALVQSHLTTLSMSRSYSNVFELDASIVQVVKLGNSVLSYTQKLYKVVNTKA
jgi:hypothetical protein